MIFYSSCFQSDSFRVRSLGNKQFVYIKLPAILSTFFFCRREWYLTLRKIVLYMWISQNPILDQSAWDQVAFSSRTSFQVYYGFFIDADTLLMSSDDDSPYSPEKRTKRPMGFPDSGIMQVAFEIVCHERKPPVFSHLVGLCMTR